MTSTYAYDPNELPCSHRPYGLQWLTQRLTFAGYTGAAAYASTEDHSKIQITIDDPNVSRNQILQDITPQTSLGAGNTHITISPGNSILMPITGPEGTEVYVKFVGVGFVQETNFVIPEGGSYDFQIGPCPPGQAVVEPQTYHFYTPGTSISPVGVIATFM